MLAILAPLLAVAGFVAYFVAATRFAVWRETPWEFLLVIALGAALGVYAAWRNPGIGTVVSASLATAVLAFASWYLLSYSMYGTREDRPRPGETFPDFALTTSTGEVFRLADAGSRRHLIILYRGDW